MNRECMHNYKEVVSGVCVCVCVVCRVSLSLLSVSEEKRIPVEIESRKTSPGEKNKTKTLTYTQHFLLYITCHGFFVFGYFLPKTNVLTHLIESASNKKGEKRLHLIKIISRDFSGSVIVYLKKNKRIVDISLVFFHIPIAKKRKKKRR